LTWKVLEKIIIYMALVQNQNRRIFVTVYLVQDNMNRRAMRRAFESARRFDARYDVRAVENIMFWQDMRHKNTH
jgi:hypothetical protein